MGLLLASARKWAIDVDRLEACPSTGARYLSEPCDELVLGKSVRVRGLQFPAQAADHRVLSLASTYCFEAAR